MAKHRKSVAKSRVQFFSPRLARETAKRMRARGYPSKSVRDPRGWTVISTASAALLRHEAERIAAKGRW